MAYGNTPLSGDPLRGGLVFGAQIFASLFHPLAKTQL